VRGTLSSHLSRISSKTSRTNPLTERSHRTITWGIIPLAILSNKNASDMRRDASLEQELCEVPRQRLRAK